jgi:hypothetical protein
MKIMMSAGSLLKEGLQIGTYKPNPSIHAADVTVDDWRNAAK